MANKFDFTIIGAGPMGLYLAYLLARSGKKIRIFDSNLLPGGHARPIIFNGILIEIFYHFFYKNDHLSASKWIDAFAKKKIAWKKINTEIIRNNSNKLDNLDGLFKIISIYKVQSIRIIFQLLKLFLFSIPKNINKKKAFVWSREVFGEKFSKDIWEPLLEGKFESNWKNVSALWLATRIKRHLSTKDLKSRKSLFGYLVNTYLSTINNNIKFLKKNKAQINMGVKIKKIIVKNNKVIAIRTAKGKVIKINEKVVSTLPLFILKKIIDNKKLSYLKKFKGMGVIVCLLEYKFKLSDAYWTSISHSNLSFNAIIQQNRLFSKSKREIIYTSKYTSINSKLFKTKEAKIKKRIILDIKKFYPEFDPTKIISFKIFKSTGAAPVPSLSTVNNLPPLKSILDNFWHGGLEYIYPEDRGVGNSIEISDRLFKQF